MRLLRTLLVLFLVTCFSSILKAQASDEEGVCSEEEIRAIESLHKKSTEEAVEFASHTRSVGLKIQQAVLNRDLAALFAFVEDELGSGPRKAFIKNKQFNEIFSDEWRQIVLTDEPACAPFSWRGLMLGPGLIWYDVRSDGTEYIFAINDAVEEVPEERLTPEWVYKEQVLKVSCFRTIWRSGDNYEEFHERFAVNEDYETFSRFIGKFIGKQVPLGAVQSPWKGMLGSSDTIALAVNISECQQEVDEETREELEHIYDRTYQVLKTISATNCSSLAPSLPHGCEEVALVTVQGPFGYSYTDVNTVLYGIARDPDTDEAYVVPLVNFDDQNKALNFVEELH